MYCTVKEIIRDVLDTDVPDSECVFAVVLTRGGCASHSPGLEPVRRSAGNRHAAAGRCL
ncbi:YcjA [Escherichia coli]|nr:YcjA [Escherichia coli]